jgi:5-methylcytosine-specific restriction endonuclease McrA
MPNIGTGGFNISVVAPLTYSVQLTVTEVQHLKSAVYAANSRAKHRAAVNQSLDTYVRLVPNECISNYDGKCALCRTVLTPHVVRVTGDKDKETRAVIDRVDVTQMNYAPSNWQWLCYGCNACKSRGDLADHLWMHVQELEAALLLASGFTSTGSIHLLGTHYNHRARAGRRQNQLSPQITAPTTTNYEH